VTLIIPLSQESTQSEPVRIEVYAERGEGFVTLTLPPCPDKYGSDTRLLDPDEARALAAALQHYAEEASK
jgi:hypothetical protein